MKTEITAIASHDIEEVVRLHMEAFPSFFLTFLGPGFLKEFYGSFTWDSAGAGFVARDIVDGALLGVIVGPVSPEGYFKRLLWKRWWAFGLASIGAVLKSPRIIPRLSRAVFYRGDKPLGMARSLLSSIAVSPQAQGRGIGEVLMRAWIAEVHRRGSRGCFLTTDARDNDKVNRFYERLGWKLEASFSTPEGRLMNRYTLDLPPVTETRENEPRSEDL
ncbi:MAG TPA: GNAT family N-acetyltransferase [Sedimentisphaerales bacterium]|nr:GNAT family N-acetyltransferase [Sedimentisphaerales bacterium]